MLINYSCLRWMALSVVGGLSSKPLQASPKIWGPQRVALKGVFVVPINKISFLNKKMPMARSSSWNLISRLSLDGRGLRDGWIGLQWYERWGRPPATAAFGTSFLALSRALFLNFQRFDLTAQLEHLQLFWGHYGVNLTSALSLRYRVEATLDLKDEIKMDRGWWLVHPGHGLEISYFSKRKMSLTASLQAGGWRFAHILDRSLLVLSLDGAFPKQFLNLMSFRVALKFFGPTQAEQEVKWERHWLPALNFTIRILGLLETNSFFQNEMLQGLWSDSYVVMTRPEVLNNPLDLKSETPHRRESDGADDSKVSSHLPAMQHEKNATINVEKAACVALKA